MQDHWIIKAMTCHHNCNTHRNAWKEICGCDFRTCMVWIEIDCFAVLPQGTQMKAGIDFWGCEFICFIGMRNIKGVSFWEVFYPVLKVKVQSKYKAALHLKVYSILVPYVQGWSLWSNQAAFCKASIFSYMTSSVSFDRWYKQVKEKQ